MDFDDEELNGAEAVRAAEGDGTRGRWPHGYGGDVGFRLEGCRVLSAEV
jgi:hypothetical protein